MRVISQNGMIDVPYEQVVIQRFKTGIYFLNKNLIGVEQIMYDMELAIYSTKEKAQNAMEQLRCAYACNNIATFNKATCRNLSDEEIKTVVSGIFKFPTEEELE